MELELGDVQTTALIPLAIKANETLRPNARIQDPKAVEMLPQRNAKIHAARQAICPAAAQSQRPLGHFCLGAIKHLETIDI